MHVLLIPARPGPPGSECKFWQTQGITRARARTRTRTHAHTQPGLRLRTDSQLLILRESGARLRILEASDSTLRRHEQGLLSQTLLPTERTIR